MSSYDCDCCGRACSRIHHLVAYGGDVDCCDDCCSYDWEAYGENHDPVLHPELAAELQREWDHDHREPQPGDTP